MPLFDKESGSINLSAKWLLRMAAVLLIAVGLLLFFFTEVKFKTCGIVFALGLAALITAEFTEH